MTQKISSAIMVTDVDTGKSYIRHSQCVGEAEVVSSTSVSYPATRTKPYTCGYCGGNIPLRQPSNPNRERGAFGGKLDT